MHQTDRPRYIPCCWREIGITMAWHHLVTATARPLERLVRHNPDLFQPWKAEASNRAQQEYLVEILWTVLMWATMSHYRIIFSFQWVLLEWQMIGYSQSFAFFFNVFIQLHGAQCGEAPLLVPEDRKGVCPECQA